MGHERAAFVFGFFVEARVWLDPRAAVRIFLTAAFAHAAREKNRFESDASLANRSSGSMAF